MEEQVIIGLSNEILSKLDALAQKIGVTVEQIWPWLVKQQYIDAIIPLVLLPIITIIAYFVFKRVVKIDWKAYDNNYEQIVGSSIAFMVVIAVIMAGIVFIDNISKLFNPEYWALKDLMGMMLK